MISPTHLLSIALNLSVLTFYIGVLLLVLPIPLRSVKKWGSRLVVDGFTAAALIFASTLIFEFIDYLKTMLGVESPSLFMTMKFAEYGGIMLVARVVGTLLSPLTFKVSSTIASIIVSVMTMVISALATLMVFLTMVTVARDVLVSLGVLLYSLPFRIGRSAGAALIAFTVIGNILLPLFPSWYEILSAATPLPGLSQHSLEDGRVYFMLCFHPFYGNPSKAIARLVKDGTKYMYMVDSSKCMLAMRPLGGVPPGEYEVQFSYLGIRFKTEPSKIKIPNDLEKLPIGGLIDYTKDIIVHNSILKESFAIEFHGCGPSSISVVETGNELIVRCTGSHDYALIRVASPRDCNVTVSVSGRYRNMNNATYDLVWHGVPVIIRTFFFQRLELIEVRVTQWSEKCSFTPQLEKDLVKSTLAKVPQSYYLSPNILMDLVYGAMYMLVRELIAVLSFTGLYIMLTYGFARALGASYVRFPFPV